MQGGKRAPISHIIITSSPAYLRNSSKEHNHFPPIISYWFSSPAKRQSRKRSGDQRRRDQRGQEWGIPHSSVAVRAVEHNCHPLLAHFYVYSISDFKLILWEPEFHSVTWVLRSKEYAGTLLGGWLLYYYLIVVTVISIRTNIIIISGIFFLQWMIIIANTYFHHQAVLPWETRSPRIP